MNTPLEPVPVRLTEIAAEVSLGQAPARQGIITEYTTTVVDLVNTVRPVLQANKNRLQAIILVSGQLGQTAEQTSFGWLDDTKAKAEKAASQADGTGGAYLSAASTLHVPFTVYGQNALWVALDANATTPLTLTVIADYSEG